MYRFLSSQRILAEPLTGAAGFGLPFPTSTKGPVLAAPPQSGSVNLPSVGSLALGASLVAVRIGTSFCVCSSAVLGERPVLTLPTIALLSPSFGPLTMRRR